MVIIAETQISYDFFTCCVQNDNIIHDDNEYYFIFNSEIVGQFVIKSIVLRYCKCVIEHNNKNNKMENSIIM